jgi:hypothetical protein
MTNAIKVNTTVDNKLVHTPMPMQVLKVVASFSSPTSTIGVEGQWPTHPPLGRGRQHPHPLPKKIPFISPSFHSSSFIIIRFFSLGRSISTLVVDCPGFAIHISGL